MSLLYRFLNLLTINHNHIVSCYLYNHLLSTEDIHSQEGEDHQEEKEQDQQGHDRCHTVDDRLYQVLHLLVVSARKENANVLLVNCRKSLTLVLSFLSD